MKNVKEPAPHVKAAQIEKEAVRALSVDEVEEALTKSTFGGEKKPTDDMILTEPAEVRALEEENETLRKTVEQLKAINSEWSSGVDPQDTVAGLMEEKEELREKLKLAHTELDAMENEVADLRKKISKMKQAHATELEELNDEIMELKILAKKKNEYADALDEDSVAFGKIRSVAAAIAGMADSIQSLAYMVQDETEARV